MRYRSLLMLSLTFGLAAATCLAQPRQAYFKAADGKWQPLQTTYDPQHHVVSFTLQPSQLHAGATTVVLGLPPGINLDDHNPPRVVSLQLDERTLPDVAKLDLDWLPAQPRTLTATVRDAENPLDLASLRVELNGHTLPADRVHHEFLDAAHHSLRLSFHPNVYLDRQASLTNTISFRLSDRSPQQNTVSRTITYRHLGKVTANPLTLVDSCTPGYEDLKVLTDGVVMTPGHTTFGVTWASLEQPGDHWVVLAWPEERELRSVEIFWANYQGVFWASRRLLVQTWDGEKWVTRRQLDNIPATRSTLIDLGPGVKSSRLRLLQPNGMGYPSRPQIMWLTEIKVK